MTTVYVVLAAAIPVLGYEIYTLTQAGVWTISVALKHLGQGVSPFFAYIICSLPGHFFVQPPREYTFAHYASEEGELFVYLWVGWCLYIAGEAGYAPQTWWQWWLLGVLAFTYGGFGWTIGY